jgi:hypothetical protein
MIYGQKYSGVPQNVVLDEELDLTDQPKSLSLSWSLIETKIFSGFMSLWIMFIDWR